MTDKQKIKKLEVDVEVLTARILALEARPPIIVSPAQPWYTPYNPLPYPQFDPLCITSITMCTDSEKLQSFNIC